MHLHKTTVGRFMSLFAVGLLVLTAPLPVMAAAPSSIIPCGFDLNGDKVIKDVAVPVFRVFPLVSDPHEECYFDDVIVLAQNVINFLIFNIAAPLGAVMFAYAGYLYVTNAGNEGQVKQAHDIFLNVFWGLIIALGAWVTVNFVLEFFLGAGSGFNFLGP